MNDQSGEALSLEDQLSLAIGRFARSHAHLDQLLRELHKTLSAPSPAMYLSASVISTKSLIDQCQVMLDNSGATESVIRAGSLVLEAATRDNRARNKVVHDWWVRIDADAAGPHDGTWTTLSPRKKSLGHKAESRDLSSVREELEQIARTIARVLTLDFALRASLPFWKGSGIEMSPGALPILLDEFDLLPDGGMKPHVESGLSTVED